jgi:dimethylaniline monooxygenase (N-oxide forming)
LEQVPQVTLLNFHCRSLLTLHVPHYAGLAAAKNGLAFDCDVTVFEQSSEVGGTWVYTDDIGKNKHGLDVHSSMYRGLHTNLPKEIMGYPDFPIPPQDKSYIPAEDFLAFLNSYADEFQVRDKIRFEQRVVNCRPLRDDSWEVCVRDLRSGSYETLNFDLVFICNGHYHTPIIPKYERSDSFRGRQIHSHDYRCPEPFSNQSVLVIGAGPSGMDLANEISKKASRVTLSHHLPEPPKTQFQPNVDQKPDVQRLTEDGAVFDDGTAARYSVIFYCTGYQYTFPFLSVDSGITCDDNYVRPLFKHCIAIKRPTLAFIGLPFYVCATQMFDLQARFCLTFMTGRKKLPSRQKMMREHEREMNERWSKGYKKHQAHMMGFEQSQYYEDLACAADIEPLQPVIAKLHDLSSLRFLDDLTRFRNDIFRIVDDETFIKVQ